MKTVPYKLNAVWGVACYVDARLTAAHGSPEEDDEFIVARFHIVDSIMPVHNTRDIKQLP